MAATLSNGVERGRPSGRQILLLGLAALLTCAAALAIGVFIFGGRRPHRGRVLGSTAALAAHGLLSLPAAMLFDRRRLVSLAAPSPCSRSRARSSCSS